VPRETQRDMRKIPVPVPEDTFDRLIVVARHERRSAAAQALVLIEQGLADRPRTPSLARPEPVAEAPRAVDGGGGNASSEASAPASAERRP
jgi:hypothetical protein